MDSEKRRRAELRLTELSTAAGSLTRSVLAIGEPLSAGAVISSPAALVARHMLGNLPGATTRTARLADLLAELQRADAEGASAPARKRHG